MEVFQWSVVLWHKIEHRYYIYETQLLEDSAPKK